MNRNELFCLLGVFVLVGFFIFRASGCVSELNTQTHQQTLKKIELNCPKPVN